MNFLPGWSRSAGNVFGPLTSVSLFDTALSTGQNITAPAGIKQGDFMLLLDMCRTGILPVPTAVVPSGFTNIINSGLASGDDTLRQIASYKIAVGNEGGTSLTGMSAAFALVRKELAVFRGNNPAVSVNISTPGAQISNTNPTAQTVLAGAGAAPLIVFGCYGSHSVGGIDPRTFTPAADAEITAASDAWLAWKIYNASPANVSIDMDDEGLLNTLQSFFVELT